MNALNNDITKIQTHLGCRYIMFQAILYLVGIVNYSPLFLSLIFTTLHIFNNRYLLIFEIPILILLIFKHIYKKTNLYVFLNITVFFTFFIYLRIISYGKKNILNFSGYDSEIQRNKYENKTENYYFTNFLKNIFYFIAYAIIIHFIYINKDNNVPILLFVAGVINSLIDCKDQLLKIFNLIKNKKFFK
jgi:hypothetical protein